ncbi:hypothetical protein ZIOFF_065818 [Zingiber officinale]|uniref:Uncharacterized protein n=1 Tax=Zingiber officinale TaxID=94328 RepID=A0A8J5EXK4_ZINOF|nr:hypothetical protein ZIOFF_065818 [Zingiber officinale]
MGSSSCCSKAKAAGLQRGGWSSEEDALLTNYIHLNGECRLRWMNYLRPGIKRGNIGTDEEDLIIRLHRLLGNRWSLIAKRLPGRTVNEIKNYWNSHLSKKLSYRQPEGQEGRGHARGLLSDSRQS